MAATVRADITTDVNPTIERVNELSGEVTRCCDERMRIRRSSLRDGPCADDVLLKCMTCYRIQTHGIPITREAYERELDNREGRIVDMVDDGPDSVEDNLEALGYIDY